MTVPCEEYENNIRRSVDEGFITPAELASLMPSRATIAAIYAQRIAERDDSDTRASVLRHLRRAYFATVITLEEYRACRTALCGATCVCGAPATMIDLTRGGRWCGACWSDMYAQFRAPIDVEHAPVGWSE